MMTTNLLRDPKCGMRLTRVRYMYRDGRGRLVAMLICRFCGRRWIRLARDVTGGTRGDPRRRAEN